MLDDRFRSDDCESHAVSVTMVLFDMFLCSSSLV